MWGPLWPYGSPPAQFASPLFLHACRQQSVLQYTKKVTGSPWEFIWHRLQRHSIVSLGHHQIPYSDWHILIWHCSTGLFIGYVSTTKTIPKAKRWPLCFVQQMNSLWAAHGVIMVRAEKMPVFSVAVAQSPLHRWGRKNIILVTFA